MQKVVSVNINMGAEKRAEVFHEHEFPEVNKYLEQGYRVVQFYQITPAQGSFLLNLTFVLEKPNR